MILDEVVLNNFGVYRGRQQFTLTPASPERPVILVGALNGCGKTTLLDSFQLAFFGKLGQCSGRGNLPYKEYLRRSIHRSVPANEGASIEVEFRQHINGQEERFRVLRSWSAPNGSVKENLEVLRNGWVDRVLTERWAEHIEEVLPSRIASLFFFDGEKIEEYADIGRSAEILSTAIHSLLGLDIVERLQSDLQILERRKKIGLKKADERKAIDLEKEKLEDLDQGLQHLKQRRAALNTEVFRQRKVSDDAKTAFRREGGELYEQRQSLAEQRLETLNRRAKIEDELRELAGDTTPLLIVLDRLTRLSEQDSVEVAAGHAAAILDVLQTRDKEVTDTLQNRRVAKASIDAVRALLSSDRKSREAQAKQNRYLNLDEEARTKLSFLLSGGLSSASSRAREILVAHDEVQHELLDMERTINGIPSSDLLEPLIGQLAAAQTSVNDTERELAKLDEEIARCVREFESQRSSLASLLDKGIHLKLEEDDTHRILVHAGRVRDTLSKFRGQVVEHHVSKIERLVAQSFSQLLHKESLITAVEIDPNTFAITLRDGQGDRLSPERLSAGERQLFAVALLWSLAQASGRSAPTIIDTPLGRLDSHHRQHLVNRYFPAASHQVLLLSTDEEIDDRYYSQLSPHLSRSYLLQFDEDSGGTRVSEGYFCQGGKT